MLFTYANRRDGSLNVGTFSSIIIHYLTLIILMAFMKAYIVSKFSHMYLLTLCPMFGSHWCPQWFDNLAVTLAVSWSHVQRKQPDEHDLQTLSELPERSRYLEEGVSVHWPSCDKYLYTSTSTSDGIVFLMQIKLGTVPDTEFLDFSRPRMFCSKFPEFSRTSGNHISLGEGSLGNNVLRQLSYPALKNACIYCFVNVFPYYKHN